MKKKIIKKDESVYGKEKLTISHIVYLKNIVFLNKFRPRLNEAITIVDAILYFLCFSIIPLISLIISSKPDEIISSPITFYLIFSVLVLFIICLMVYNNYFSIPRLNIEIEKKFDKNMNMLSFNKDNFNDFNIMALRLLLIELKSLNLINNNTCESNLTINEFKKLFNKKVKQLKKIENLGIQRIDNKII